MSISASELTVIVGSQNPVKVAAVKSAFQAHFPDTRLSVTGITAPSGVADQPMTEEETLLGAQNRVVYCREQHAAADFCVAIEGGVDQFSYGAATFAYVVINGRQQTCVGKSAQLPLPSQFYQALQAGQELGDVIDAHFGTVNAKQKGGAIGLLTNGLASRQSAYEQALIMALGAIKHKALFTQ